VEFIIPKERECTDLYTTLTQWNAGRREEEDKHFLALFSFCVALDSYEKLYCFLYQAPHHLEKVWDPFSLATEYMRMGVPSPEWKVEDSNEQFELCQTYPRIIYVPASTTKSMLLASSKFRSRGRLPVLTYLHHNGVCCTLILVAGLISFDGL
jgi:myotubularin-related protein 6/7/8